MFSDFIGNSLDPECAGDKDSAAQKLHLIAEGHLGSMIKLKKKQIKHCHAVGYITQL